MKPPDTGPPVKLPSTEIDVRPKNAALGSFFNLDDIEMALASSGFRVQDSIRLLVDIINSPMPTYGERLRAEKQLRELIKDALNVQGEIVTSHRKVSGTDNDGRQISEVQVARRLLERNTANVGNPSPGILVRQPGSDQAAVEAGARSAETPLDLEIDQDADVRDSGSGDAGLESDP